MNWLNAVDQSYRDEFRELFESNFGRVEARLREMDARVDAKLDRLEARLIQHVAELRVDSGRMETRLIRWMFGFWIGSWVALAGTLIALQRIH